MKQVFTLLTLIFATAVFGQSTNRIVIPVVTFDCTLRVTHFDSSSALDVVGEYISSNGMVGDKFVLDSSHSFHKIGFGCYGQEVFDSGQWRLQNNNTLILTGTKAETFTAIIKLGDYYYFVVHSQRQKLVKDYLETKKKFRNARPFTIDGQTFSVEYMIRRTLLNKYYSKELEEFTGT